MDYTKLPRKLIYKDISSLEELVEKNEDLTLFINNMLSNRYFRSSDAKDRALKCFNTAYYICTLILLSDKHSNWYFRTYCEIAYCDDNRNKVYQAFTLSLVYIFLSHTCFEMPDETIIKSLEDELSNPLNFLQKGDPFLNDYYYSDACKDLQKGLGKDWAIIDPFDHRRINNDIYHDVDGSDVIWAFKTNYYRREEIEKIVKALGRDASEKHILVDLIRRDAERFYGFNGAPFVENVKPMLEDLDSCISKEYHEQSDTSEDDITVQPSPTADIIEMKSHISELEKENKQLKEENETLKEHMQSSKELQSENERLKNLYDASDKQLKKENKQLKEENEALSLKVLESESNEPKWIDCFDVFLHPNLNPEEIAKELKQITHASLPKKERGYWYVFVTVLGEINWIPTPNNMMALQWANLHFDCGWDWRKKHRFNFSDINKKIKGVQPSSKWNSSVTGNVIGDYYGELAKNMREAFVEVVEGNHLLDKKKFIKHGCTRINNGHN